jgi:hypothetical protein
VDREEFVTAVSGNNMSTAAADPLVAERLSTDPPGHSDLPAS